MSPERPLHEVVQSPRGPIAYERWGSGPPLLLIAGLASRARLWGELPRLLADRFTVLAPDNRGVGGSREGAPFTPDGAADDCVSVIADAGFRSASVLGVSMGGVIACLTATRHPETVDVSWSPPAPPA